MKPYILFFLGLSSLYFTNVIFAHSLPGRSNDPFSDNDLAHGYHIHAPFEYALGEGMHWGLHKEFGGHFEIAFAPIFSLNGDKYERLINLNEQGHSENRGYLFKENKSITGALGLDFHLGFGMPVASFSLMPQTAKHTYVERRVPNKQAVKKLSKKVTIPSNLEELSQWRVGDRFFYKKSTSLTFMMDGGLEPFIYTGPVFNVTGDWIVGFEKLDSSKMRFSVTKSKIFSFGYELDGIFFALGVEKFQGKDRLFQFDLDFNYPQVQEVLRDLLKGKFETAQEASQDICSGVTSIDYELAKYKGFASFQLFIIPFLWGASHIATNSSSQTDYPHEDDHKKAYSSINLEKSNTVGVLSNHKLKLSMSFVDLNIEKNKDTSFAAAYSWVFEKGNLKKKDINKRLSELKDKIGLRSQIFLEKLGEKKGYAKIQFLNRISMAALTQLVYEAHTSSKATWLTRLEMAVRAYFDRNQGSIAEKDYPQFIKAGEILLEKIIKLLKKARTAMLDGNYKSFTKYTSKAISLIHQDPGVFSCFMKPLEGYQLYLAIEGEHMPMQQKELYIP